MKKQRAIFIVLASLCCLIPGVSLASNLVNINTADAKTLTTLKGIGEKRAEAIIAYRKEHGDFQSLDDLLGVKGMTAKRLAKLEAENQEELSLKDN